MNCGCTGLSKRYALSKSINNVDLIVFDVDGTLTATNEVDSRCFARALRDTFGINISTQWQAYAHITDSGITHHNFVEHFGRPPTAVELDRFRERFLALLEQRWRQAPFDFAQVPGVSKALARIAHQQRYKTAIASGGWRASALFKLAKAGLNTGRFPAAFADDAQERENIARMAISRAQAHYGWHFRRIIFVGDADWDMTTAARLGIAFVGIAHHKEESTLRGAGAKIVLPDYQDFAAFAAALDAAEAPRSA